MENVRKLCVLASLVCVPCVASPAAAAVVDIAVDIDSTRLSATDVGGPLNTQPGFVSWALTDFTVTATEPSISEQGVTLRLFGLGNNLSRVRAAGGDGTGNDDLTQDFVYNEGAAGRGIGLRISGLDVGEYAMQSWHFDQVVMNVENFIQVEVRDPGQASTILVDRLPFGSTPASFSFAVTEPGQVKEIVFREDDAPTETDAVDQNRARLNGFTLTNVPEPGWASMLAAVAAGLAVRRRRA